MFHSSFWVFFYRQEIRLLLRFPTLSWPKWGPLTANIIHIIMTSMYIIIDQKMQILFSKFEVKAWHTFPLFLWLLTTLICSHVLPYPPHPPHPVPICQSYKSFSRPNTQRGNWVFHTSTWSVPLYLVLPKNKEIQQQFEVLIQMWV